MKSKECIIVIKITTKHSGKMKGLISINTNSLTIPNCIERAKNDKLVCGACYSNKLLKLRPVVANAYQVNNNFLSMKVHDQEYLPRLNASTVRFNAFGELINIEHAINLIKICYKNKNTQFSLWTKETAMIWKAIRDFGKPDNLILIYSDYAVNKPIKEMPRYFDKTFTVWSKDHKNADFINCGAKACFDCFKCYDKEDKTTHIHEVLK